MAVKTTSPNPNPNTPLAGRSRLKIFPNSFFIPGNIPSKKSSKKAIGSVVVMSDYAKKYIKSTMMDWERHKDDVKEVLSKLTRPYHVEFYWIRETKGRFDYVNMLQMPLDMMQEAGWIPDDDCDHVVPVVGGFHVDKENAGVIVTFKNFVQRVNL